MSPTTFAIGSVEVVSVRDAIGVLGELDRLYPEVPADAWQPYRELYPEVFAGARWRLPVACQLLRSGGRAVLVDTGVGPPGLWDWEAESEGGLPRLIDPSEIDTVFLTHLHVDHVGWNGDADGTPLFRRYVVHHEALAFARAARRPYAPRCIEPLVASGLVETVGGETEVAPGIVAFETPGHYPGHMSLRLDGRGTLLGDAFPHPAHLDRPDWRFLHDSDPDEAVRTRRALLPEIVDNGVVVCGHYPDAGVGRVVRRKGRAVWESLA